ncbi:MAG: 1-acyl-sn-glycerol-3-phosphate acyltransferase [Oscillospiraceae bacterium]|nr:1-acyl-sn-glycerol-3-phosphate acyltransferase [Oscillospiraceae bacterium]
MEKKKTKKNSWVKLRHKIITAIGEPVLTVYTKWRYNIVIDKFKEQGDRQYLVVMNHQTAFDQFFIAAAFRGPVYYIATEDIFSLGWVSKLISWLVAPIPIKKQTTDLKAVKTCLRVAKEGGTIALAPEGNRTYCGRTVYMKPSIAKLAKTLRLPIAIFRIEGGYGVQPRWCDDVRKGTMHAGVTRVIEPEEYKAMTDEELFAVIEKEMWVDEAKVDGEYHSSHLAEYLERAIYVCPDCGLAQHESHGDIITCKKCGRQTKYLPTKEFQGVDSDFPFRFVGNWYDYQCDFVNSLDVTQLTETPLFCDKANLAEVIVYEKKHPLKENCDLKLFGDRVEIDGDVLYFDDISSVAVLGRNKTNIYWKDKIYQLKGDKRFNALKYVNIYHRYKNIKEGNEDGKFLGL